MEENKVINLKIFQDRDLFSVFSDAKLLTEDGWSFDVHRIILANNSTFFRQVFCNSPNDRGSTLIPNIKGEILKQVLDFIYTDTVAFNKNNFLDIMMVSDFMKIEGLYNLSKKFTESILSTENCLQIFATSKRINEKSLQELSFRIILTNFEKLRNEQYFAEMPVEYIKQILKENSLLVTGENMVWDFVAKWTRKDPPNRFKEICCLLKCLKLEDIDESLANEIVKSDIISKNPYCDELQKMTLQKYQSSLDTLKYIISFSKAFPEIPFSKINSRRLPDCLNVIVCQTDGSNHFRIFLTYDQKVDLWRKLAEFPVQDYHVHIIGGNVYIFDFHMRDAWTFNLYTQQWREMANFVNGIGIGNKVSCSVVIESKIYLLFNDPIRRRLRVNVYNTENRLWSDAMPMYKMFEFKAVSLLNKIFVVGKKLERGVYNISAQIYDERTNSWSFITTPPSINRSNFRLIAYHDKVYILDGVAGGHIVKTVEVFNVARNEWERTDDYPLTNDAEPFRTVLVFNDKLFAIFGADLDTKQFVLDEITKKWVEPEKLLPLKDSVFFEHLIAFHTIYDRQRIHILMKQSRRPGTVLEKSPFQ